MCPAIYLGPSGILMWAPSPYFLCKPPSLEFCYILPVPHFFHTSTDLPVIFAGDICRSLVGSREKGKPVSRLLDPLGRRSEDLVARSNCAINTLPSFFTFIIHKTLHQHFRYPQSFPTVRDEQSEILIIIIENTCERDTDFSLASAYQVSDTPSNYATWKVHFGKFAQHNIH